MAPSEAPTEGIVATDDAVRLLSKGGRGGRPRMHVAEVPALIVLGMLGYLAARSMFDLPIVPWVIPALSMAFLVFRSVVGRAEVPLERR